MNKKKSFFTHPATVRITHIIKFMKRDQINFIAAILADVTTNIGA